MRISEWSSDVCSSDLRVKLADRLHNMRTLHFIPSAEKRRRIARGTIDIYAPLAERIGMYEFMSELQDLAFRELEPEAWDSINKRLTHLREGGGNIVARISSNIRMLLGRDGIEAEVDGREKQRSEAHTSELQSLMRISYPVFGL